MEYIFHNWSQLSLVDRAWFVVGAWLLILFIGVFMVKGIKSLRKKHKNDSQNFNES